jgi:hypothetical protein
LGRPATAAIVWGEGPALTRERRNLTGQHAAARTHRVAVGVDNPCIGSYARNVNCERILVTATPAELRSEMPGVVDVYDALSRQFFWADTVIIGPQDELCGDDTEVLEGEVVV